MSTSGRKRKTKPARLSQHTVHQISALEEDDDNDSNASGYSDYKRAVISVDDNDDGDVIGKDDAGRFPFPVGLQQLMSHSECDGTAEPEVVQLRAHAPVGDMMNTIETVLSAAATNEDKQRRLDVMIQQLETIRASLRQRCYQQQDSHSYSSSIGNCLEVDTNSCISYVFNKMCNLFMLIYVGDSPALEYCAVFCKGSFLLKPKRTILRTVTQFGILGTVCFKSK